MALDLRHPLVSDGAPALRPILLVEAVHLPAERRRIVHRRDVAVEPDLERLFLVLRNRRRHAHHVAPDDRTGVRETRDGCRPADVLASGGVPSLRKRKTFGDATRIDAAELRPVDAGPRTLLGEGEARRRQDRNSRESGYDNCLRDCISHLISRRPDDRPTAARAAQRTSSSRCSVRSRP